MNDIVKKDNNQALSSVIDMNQRATSEDIIALSQCMQNTVGSIASAIDGTINGVRDIKMISAQVEIETKRIENALECLLIKTKGDIQMYRDTLPLLEKNFDSMQARMDKLMDKAMDLITEDISEASLMRQEMAMRMIETTNNTLNNLISKLLPRFN